MANTKTRSQLQGDLVVLPFPELVNQKVIIRDIRNYLAGQVVGITRDETLLDEVLKCAFCRVHLQRTGNAPLITTGLTMEETAQLYQETLQKIRKRFGSLFENDTAIQLAPEHVYYLDRALSVLDLLDPSRDLIGDIYEAFMGSGYRGQEGQFFTPKNAAKALVALVAPRTGETICDPACGPAGLLLEAARTTGESGDGVAQHVYGIDKDRYLARLGRLRLALYFGVPVTIECADSLAWGGNGFDHSPVKDMRGTFSVVLANPPFGSKIVALAGEARRTFDLAHKWIIDKKGTGRYIKTSAVSNNTPPQVLFVERCLSLLRDGGRLGIVLPESVLSNVGHRYLVNYILDHATPLAVIGMPESLFKTSGKGGTHTKVCLVVLQKGAVPTNHHMFMAEAKWCGHDSRGNDIPLDDLPAIVEKYRAYSQGETVQPDRTGFLVPLANIRDLVLAPRFYDPEPVQQMETLRETHDIYKIADLMRDGFLHVTTGDEPGKLAYGGGNIPFVRTSDISSWEIKVDPKHLVDKDIYAKYAKRQDVREGDILMVRDGTYLIGACAMVSRYDTRIVFQSHIYKIRVAPKAPFDNYLLLAALASPPVKAQIRARSFTQDIIDSLGDRIKDILIPIPKDIKARRSISAMVKRVVNDRVEARELARRARLEIVGQWDQAISDSFDSESSGQPLLS